MESSRQDLSNDMAERRSTLKNNENTFHPRFSFTLKTCLAFPETGFMFLLGERGEEGATRGSSSSLRSTTISKLCQHKNLEKKQKKLLSCLTFFFSVKEISSSYELSPLVTPSWSRESVMKKRQTSGSPPFLWRSASFVRPFMPYEWGFFKNGSFKSGNTFICCEAGRLLNSPTEENNFVVASKVFSVHPTMFPFKIRWSP